MFHVFAIPPWEIAPRAAFIQGLLIKACSRCDQDPRALLIDCLNRRAVLWVIADDNAPVGVCVTRVVKRGNDLAVENTVTGGERGLQWVGQLRDRLREFRRAEGAVCLYAWGRKGWRRVFKTDPVGFHDGKWLFEDYG